MGKMSSLKLTRLLKPVSCLGNIHLDGSYGLWVIKQIRSCCTLSLRRDQEVSTITAAKGKHYTRGRRPHTSSNSPNAETWLGHLTAYLFFVWLCMDPLTFGFTSFTKSNYVISFQTICWMNSRDRKSGSVSSTKATLNGETTRRKSPMISRTNHSGNSMWSNKCSDHLWIFMTFIDFYSMVYKYLHKLDVAMLSYSGYITC